MFRFVYFFLVYSSYTFYQARILLLKLFTGNAEMTEVFKCRKSGTKCCAPKSLIKETIGQKDDTIKDSTMSVSLPYTTQSSVTLTTPSQCTYFFPLQQISK